MYLRSLCTGLLPLLAFYNLAYAKPILANHDGVRMQERVSLQSSTSSTFTNGTILRVENATDDLFPRGIILPVQEYALWVQITPHDQLGPSLSMLASYDLLTNFKRYIREQSDWYGRYTPIADKFLFPKDGLGVTIKPSTQPGRSRDMTWNDLRGAAPTIQLHFSDVEFYPSSLIFWDMRVGRTLENYLGVGAIGRTSATGLEDALLPDGDVHNEGYVLNSSASHVNITTY